MTKAQDKFEYFEHNNAKFRRRISYGGVDDILQDGEWVPYTGNRTDPYLYGDRVGDTLVRREAERFAYYHHDNSY